MALFSLGCLSGACGGAERISELSPKEFQKQVGTDTSAVILDVRTPEEFAEGHIANAQNIDWLNQPKFTSAVKALSHDKTYYVYCRSGHRSLEASQAMKGLGFNVKDLNGGILAWEAQKLPMVK